MSDTTEAAAGANSAPATVAPEAPKFVDQKKRFRKVTLEWPLEYEGKLYTEVVVRRMTGQEVADFIRSASEEGSSARLPMLDAPPEVIDALDPDDAEQVNKAVEDFLPRSLREATEPSPNSGSTTQA